MARTILFPTDGSATARAAGRFAADIAQGEGDSVLVFGSPSVPTSKVLKTMR